MREKRGKTPVRAPCPELLRGLIVRLRPTVVRSKLVNLTVSLIGNLRQQEQFVAGEAAGRVPFIGIVLVTTFEGDGVENALLGFVGPDGGRYRMKRDLRGG